jgi:hypothetical protein
MASVIPINQGMVPPALGALQAAAPPQLGLGLNQATRLGAKGVNQVGQPLGAGAPGFPQHQNQATGLGAHLVSRNTKQWRSSPPPPPKGPDHPSFC